MAGIWYKSSKGHKIQLPQGQVLVRKDSEDEDHKDNWEAEVLLTLKVKVSREEGITDFTALLAEIQSRLEEDISTLDGGFISYLGSLTDPDE